MIKSPRTVPLAALAALVLTACGGAGGDDGPARPATVADPGFESRRLSADTTKAPDGKPWSGERAGVANGATDMGIGGHTGSQYGFVTCLRYRDRDPYWPYPRYKTIPGYLEQRIKGFVVGRRYKIHLWIARKAPVQSSEDRAKVSLALNGIPVLTETPAVDGSWKEVTSSEWTADASRATLRISGDSDSIAGTSTSLMDDVTLEELP